MKKRRELIYVLDHPASLRGTALLSVSCAMADPNERLATMYCPMEIKVQCYVRPGYTRSRALYDVCLLFGDSFHQDLHDVIDGMIVSIDPGHVISHRHGKYTIIDVYLSLELTPDMQKILDLINVFRSHYWTRTSRRYHLRPTSSKKDCLYDRLHLMSDWYARAKEGTLTSAFYKDDCALVLPLVV